MLTSKYPWENPQLEKQRRLMTAFRTLQDDPELTDCPNMALLRAAQYHCVEPADLLEFSNQLDEASFQGKVRHIGAHAYARPR